LSDKYKMIEYDTRTDTARVVTIDHGYSILGHAFVAVIKGQLHVERCKWCYDLVSACKSSRVDENAISSHAPVTSSSKDVIDLQLRLAQDALRAGDRKLANFELEIAHRLLVKK
jgi:hypothetical protein